METKEIASRLAALAALILIFAGPVTCIYKHEQKAEAAEQMVDGYGISIGGWGDGYCIDYEIIPIPASKNTRVLYYDKPADSTPKPRPFRDQTTGSSVSVTKLRFDRQKMYSR